VDTYKPASKNKVNPLMPKTLFWLWCIHLVHVQKDGNKWVTYWQLDLWLVMALWDAMDHPPYSTALGPVTSISLDPLWSKWQTTDLQQMPTWSTLSVTSDYRHLTLISSWLGYKPWPWFTMGQMLKCQ
jgi:hypothetical protein